MYVFGNGESRSFWRGSEASPPDEGNMVNRVTVTETKHKNSKIYYFYRVIDLGRRQGKE